MRFSKLPKTFRARKTILDVGFLPTEIQFSFVFKTKQKKPLVDEKLCTGFRAKNFIPNLKLNFKNRFQARKVLGCFEKRTPGLKTGMENGTFWSEIGSGFGEPGGTPPPRIPRGTPWGWFKKGFVTLDGAYAATVSS